VQCFMYPLGYLILSVIFLTPYISPCYSTLFFVPKQQTCLAPSCFYAFSRSPVFTWCEIICLPVHLIFEMMVNISICLTRFMLIFPLGEVTYHNSIVLSVANLYFFFNSFFKAIDVLYQLFYPRNFLNALNTILVPIFLTFL